MFSPAHFFMRIGLLAMLTSPASAAARTDLYGDALPPGAVARLGSVRFRFAPSICSLAFSPDGKRLAGGDSHHLVIWDVATGKRIREFKLDSVDIRLVGFHADGKIVVVGIDDSRRGSDGYQRTCVCCARNWSQADTITRCWKSNLGSRSFPRWRSGCSSLRFRNRGLGFGGDRGKYRSKEIEAETFRQTLASLSSFLPATALSPDHRTVAYFDFKPRLFISATCAPKSDSQVATMPPS